MFVRRFRFTVVQLLLAIGLVAIVSGLAASIVRVLRQPTVQVYPAKVTALAFSTDGKKLAAASSYEQWPGSEAYPGDPSWLCSEVQIYDVSKQQELSAMWAEVGGIYSLRFSPDDKTLAIGDSRGTV